MANSPPVRVVDHQLKGSLFTLFSLFFFGTKVLLLKIYFVEMNWSRDTSSEYSTLRPNEFSTTPSTLDLLRLSHSETQITSGGKVWFLDILCLLPFCCKWLDPKGALWCLEVLEVTFDFYILGPDRPFLTTSSKTVTHRRHQTTFYMFRFLYESGLEYKFIASQKSSKYTNL